MPSHGLLAQAFQLGTLALQLRAACQAPSLPGRSDVVSQKLWVPLKGL